MACSRIIPCDGVHKKQIAGELLFRCTLSHKYFTSKVPAMTYLPGNHTLVFSALVGLTSLFGMERGGSLPLSSPRPWTQKNPGNQIEEQKY